MTDRPLHTELPRWLSSASVAWVGALLALTAVALSAGFLWYAQHEIQQRELQSTELLARSLEDHANRTFSSVDLALNTLTEAVSGSLRTADPTRLGPALVQTLQGMPFLRSLSLVDGRDLAGARRSTLAANTVANTDTTAIATATATGSAHSFIPLTRLASGPADAPLYLVAALNPDFFANEYSLMLADNSRAAALFKTDGVLLAATENIRMAPGRNADGHRFFKDYLPARESGSFIGPGIDGERSVTALRTVRKRPVAVVVERDYAKVQAAFARTVGAVLAACGAALTLMGVMVGMAWRSLRSHELVQRALASTRQRVATSEGNLRTLVESVQELIFRTDAQGRISFVNGRWQEISGRPDSAALGQRLANLCMPDDRARIEALFEPDTAAAPAAVMVQIRRPRADLRTLELSVAPVRAADRSLIGFAGFAVDVSERQLARRTLESQLDFTARLIDISPTALFVKDEQGRFVTVNRAWLDLMALAPEQVIGRDSAELFGAQAPLHSEQDQRLLQSEDRISYENRLLRPDRESRDTVVTKVRFTNADGSPAGIIGSIIDVTQFREAERSTREARDSAERATRAKSEFIANITHELRTPLQAIIGFSDLGHELTSVQPELQEMFGDIHAGGQRMLTLVNGLLDVSKMESTVGSLALQRADLCALASAVVRELRPLAAQRSLRIEQPGPTQQLSADVDAFRIQQVVRNVLANALRFAPEGSRIEMVGRDHGTAGVELEVRDHGPGIPSAELETIFDAFVQSSRTRSGAGGTGLGLTICRKIMSAHGGSIWAANAASGGAVLTIRLPASPQPAALTATSAGSADSGLASDAASISAAHQARPARL